MDEHAKVSMAFVYRLHQESLRITIEPPKRIPISRFMLAVLPPLMSGPLWLALAYYFPPGGVSQRIAVMVGVGVVVLATTLLVASLSIWFHRRIARQGPHFVLDLAACTIDFPRRGLTVTYDVVERLVVLRGRTRGRGPQRATGSVGQLVIVFLDSDGKRQALPVVTSAPNKLMMRTASALAAAIPCPLSERRLSRDESPLTWQLRSEAFSRKIEDQPPCLMTTEELTRMPS